MKGWFRVIFIMQISSGFAPSEKQRGKIMGVAIAGMPLMLPVLKFRTATSRNVIMGNTGAFIIGRTAWMT